MFLYLITGILLGALLASSFVYIFLSKKYQSLVHVAEKEALLMKEQLTQVKSEFQIRSELQNQKFEGLTQDLLQKGVGILQESSVKNLEMILNPFRQKLHEFESKVQNAYNAEAKERFSLKQQVERMALVSEGLTRTLRGDFKTQGVWGEIVLERILEISGLKEGREYTLQGSDLSLTNSDGNKIKPDVIINLPDDKHLIIDSKVTLLPFEKWINLDPASPEKEAAFKAFTNAVKQHVSDLSEKHYQSSSGLRSPDFVFLFLPIEAALVSLHEKDSSLFTSAWQRKIVIVGPTTLLPTLKTVESIWKNERQNINALEIARLGGTLYDKFASFCEDLSAVGKSLSQAQGAYDESLKKLSEGKGNLLRQSERLRDLGVRSQKNLPKEVTALLQENLVDSQSAD